MIDIFGVKCTINCMKAFIRLTNRTLLTACGAFLALAVLTGCPEDKKDSKKEEQPQVLTQAPETNSTPVAAEPVAAEPAEEAKPVEETKKEEPKEAEKPFTQMTVADFDADECRVDPVSFSNYANKDHPGVNPVFYILGFSDDGKVAYSYWFPNEGRGGTDYFFYIQSLVTDKFLFSENHSDEYGVPGDSDEMTNYLKFKSKKIDQALKDNKIQKVDWKFHKFPISFNGSSYNIKVDSKTRDADNYFGQVMDFSIIADKDGKSKKTLTSNKERMIYDVFPCGYALNPLEEGRAMIIYAEIGPAFENVQVEYSITGCDLGYGFK